MGIKTGIGVNLLGARGVGCHLAEDSVAVKQLRREPGSRAPTAHHPPSSQAQDWGRKERPGGCSSPWRLWSPAAGLPSGCRAGPALGSAS